MASLYVFGIGGTGSRVIKALTMLLAAGSSINGYELVPIIIDPDEANGDVTRTIDILKNYQHIRNNLSFTNADDNRFFNTPVKNVTQNFKLALSDVNGERFKDYIQYRSLDENNKALISLLFSEDNLEADMEVGFKGNPNIGSVVLNQFTHSQDFKSFAAAFGQNDRIFIISSIFGGTGAAGFPLLLKNIRDADGSLGNIKLLQDAPIGAITMLPYFSVAHDDNSKIDKTSFISKTKSALGYYEKNINQNNTLNALYYAGDDISKNYDNNEGSVYQKNEAHFLELAAATAIIDFAQMPATAVETINGRAVNPVYKEFGIKADKPSIIFDDLGFATQFIKKPLTQYLLFTLYQKNKLQQSTDQNWAKELNMNTFLTQPFLAAHIRAFNQYYLEWLTEMASNQRSFSPYNLNANDDNLFDMVKGITPHVSFMERGGKNYQRYNFMLSKELDRLKKNDVQEQQFMNLFYNTTEKLVSEKYKF